MASNSFASAMRFGDLAGEVHGSGDPVFVLLHAGVADRRSWRDVIPHLPGTVVAYDRRGFGETAPPTGANGLEDLVEVLDAVAGDRPAWLVGNSMGGALALNCAMARPERVAGLVLIAPAVAGEPELVLDPATKRLDERIDDAQDAHEVTRLEAWLWLDGPGQPEGRVRGAARESVLAMNGVALANEAEEPLDGDAWDRLESLAVPTTVACGALDVPALLDRCAVMADRIPGAAHRVLPGVAHLPSVERPGLVAALITNAVG